MFFLKEGEAERLGSWIFLGNSDLMLGFPYTKPKCCIRVQVPKPYKIRPFILDACHCL